MLSHKATFGFNICSIFQLKDKVIILILEIFIYEIFIFIYEIFIH